MTIEKTYELTHAETFHGFTGMKLILERKHDKDDWTLTGPMHEFVTLIGWRGSDANDNVAGWKDGEFQYYTDEHDRIIKDQREAEKDYWYRKAVRIAQEQGFLSKRFKTAGELREAGKAGKAFTEKARMAVEIEAAELASLKQAALNEGTTVAEIVRTLITEYLDKRSRE